MATVVSNEFTNVSGFRKAYKKTRAEALKVLDRVGEKVRFNSDCFLLQSYRNGQWLNHAIGLSAAEDRVYTYKHETQFRLVMRFDA